MPREAHLDVPGVLHHTMIWGIEHRYSSMRPPGVGFSVERREVIARENGRKLIK